MTTSPIIQLRGVTKRYGSFTAVNGIDLDVQPGEIFGILGPNGAGKTTTLEMIEGLRAPDSGTITVAGFDAVTQVDEVRKIIGVQLQSTSLFPYLSANELMELFGHFYGIADPKQRASDLLARVDLGEKANARMEQMSGGQQQRLSIALALVNSPVVSFLDEPTTGLDPHARRSLWQTVLDVRSSGTTVVLTTHYMDEAEFLCDRIAVMDGGRIIACDTPEALIRSLPQDAIVKATASGNPAWTESALAALPGATSARLTADTNNTSIAIGSADVQATIVALLALADRDDVRLTDLASTSANLEDVFLALTGRSYSDSAEEEVTA
ncbi:MAG: ABC transporter ATP-binding protein [Thermomicrobiales bacterium]|nr:ABC transporter ATP-binding protein [Thermomicrobiales bacterium]